MLRRPRLWISASAGTGKTYQLTTRYIELLFAGVPLESIVATTFTRKAAGEILDRVFQRLLEAIRSESKRDELADAIGATSVGKSACEAALQRVLRSLHRLRVGTIDSLFAQVARCYALELHLPQGWSILDEDELAQRSETALRRLVESTEVDALRHLVHMLAKGDAVRSATELMSVAVREGYAVFRDSDVAAWDRPRAVAAPDVAIELVLEQLLALAEKYPKFRKPVEADIGRWTSGEFGELLTKGVSSKVASGESKYSRMEIPDEMAVAYGQLLDHVRSHAIHQLRLQTQGVFEVLAAFDEQVAGLRGQGLSFDDVAWFLARYVADENSIDFSFRLDGRTDHWLLDEFQDTSALQWRVLKAMIANASSSTTDGASLLCVGDSKQAIYGWRGGSARIFDSIPDDSDLQPIETDSLALSRRSSPIIIETINTVFRNFSQHNNLANYPAVADWSRAFPIHETVRKELPGYAVWRIAEDEAAVMEAAVTQVAQLHKNAPNRTIGILVRKNDTVALLRSLLAQGGVPASEEGGNPLTDSVAVSWLRAWLKLLDDPHDGVARYQVLTSPLADVVELRGDVIGPLDVDAIDRGRRQVVEQGYGPVLEQLARALEPHLSPRDARRVEQLVDLAYRYGRRASLRTSDFLALVEATRVPDPATESVRVMTIHQSKGLEFDAVVLPELGVRLYGTSDYLVAHRPEPSAPFDRVFRRPNRETRRFLTKQEQADCDGSDADRVTELLCLLYVAMTRARQALYLFTPPQKSARHGITWAGLIHAAVAPMQDTKPGERPYEIGNSEWYAVGFDARSETDENAAVRDERAAKSGPPLRMRSHGGERRLPTRVAPSRAAHGSCKSVGDLLSADRRALMRGTLVHSWFEQVQWLEGEGSTDADARMQEALVRFPAATRDQVYDANEAFTRYMRLPAIQQVLVEREYHTLVVDLFPAATLSDIARWEVHGEFPLRWINDDGEMIVGAIDRLVIGRNSDGAVGAAHIIDFKTDRLSSEAELQQRADLYRKQLASYQQVVAEMYGLSAKSVVASLLFLEHDRLLPC